MIDCPICHVMNEDMARFCAECGQRLTKPAPAGSAPDSVPAAAPPPPPTPVKLKSPLLGADLAEPQANTEKPDLSRLRGVGPAGSAAPAAGSPGASGLRSPLLGAADPGYGGSDTGPGTSASSGHHGLRSPLLGAVDPGYGGSDAGPGTSASSGHQGLRSPLLGAVDPGHGGGDPGPSTSSGHHGLRSPLLGAVDPGHGGGDPGPSTSSGHHGLRSPLLGAVDPGQLKDEAAGSTGPSTKKGLLHSPLLPGDDPLPGGDARPQAPGSRGRLKSPLLSGDDDIAKEPSSPLRSPLRADEPTGSKAHLRSPLLGGVDEAPPAAPPGRSGGLRSPILGAAETVPVRHNSAFSEPDFDDAPGEPVLRSPLLGAKVPVHDKPPAARPAPPSPPEARPADSPIQTDKRPADSNIALPETAGSNFSYQYWSQPADNGGAAQAQSAPPAAPAFAPGAVAQAAQAPSPVAENNWSRPSSSLVSDAQPGGMSIPAQPAPPAGGILGSSLTAGLDGSGATNNSLTAPARPAKSLSDLRGAASGTDSSEQPTRPRRSKMLDQPAGAEPAEPALPDRMQHRLPEPAPAFAPLPGYLKIMVVPLAFAAIMKIMTTMEFAKVNQPLIPILADQIGQLIVCICLIIICLNAGNSRRQ